MSSIISNPLVWQQVLSQSNNLSYSARGVYRVKDTDPGRKADYWFRDFGMVMACSYMTELSFRLVDKFFTIPHLTKELKLNQLSELRKPYGGNEKLYEHAQNYTRLPSVFRSRMMGTLIRGSSDLVPKIMGEIEDRRAEGIAPEKQTLKDNVKALLKDPTAAASNDLIKKAHREAGIAEDSKVVKGFSNIDNIDEREKKIQKFLSENKSVNPEKLKDALTLEDARQRGILIDHLLRNQNYKEYVIKNYLTTESHGLKSLVPDFLKEYGEKVFEATETDKEALPKALKAIWYLPPNNRGAEFDKKFNEFRQHFFVRDGKSFLSEEDLKAFGKLGDQFKAALSSSNREELDKTFTALATFQNTLSTEAKITEHVTRLASHENLKLEMLNRVKGKLESTAADIHKLIPDKNPQKEFETNLKKLNLHQFFNATGHEGTHPAELLLNQVKGLLPETSATPASDTTRTKIAEHINTFMSSLETEIKGDSKKALDTLLKPVLNAGKHPNGLDSNALKRLVHEALDSRITSGAIKKIQSSSTWPKTFLTVAFNFVFYGLAASKFDNKILQPYEKKLVAERGTSQDIVNAGYLALIPGLTVLTQLFDRTTPLAAIRRMGNLSRFSLVGGVALSTFAASTYLILQQLLKNPPKNPPKPAGQALANPPGRPSFAAALPTPGLASNNASPFALPSAPGGFNNNSFAMMNGNSFAALPNGSSPMRFGQQVISAKPQRELTRQA